MDTDFETFGVDSKLNVCALFYFARNPKIFSNSTEVKAPFSHSTSQKFLSYMERNTNRLYKSKSKCQRNPLLRWETSGMKRL